jgi:predicted ATPase
LIAQLAPEVTLPAELHRQVVVKTDGVPLFVEEVTKMVLELGDSDPAQPASPLTIPITLQDSLMARLDRLARGKEVAQLGAILGREFSYDLLLAVAGRSEAILRRDLAALVEAELLYQHGLPPQATYFFKHALLQEAAYQTMLRRKRQHYHRTIAQTLTDHFPEIAGRQPELLAHHYALAGLNEAAVQYFQAAAQQALGRSANLEAIEHLTSALALLKTWPDSPARTQQQLALQIALGGPYLMTKGYAALAVEQLYAEAWQLCQSVGDAPQRAAALFGLWVFYLVRADYVIARQLGDQIMAVAQEPANAAFLLEAHQVQGINHFYLGEFAAARHHLEQAMQHAPPDAPPVMAGNPGPNSGANAAVACLCHAALTLWLLGYPDQARQRIEAALALARRLAHPYSQVFALAFMAWLHQYRREGSLAEQHAEAAMTAAGEHAFELLLPFSLIFKGWAMAEQGRPEAGIVLLKEGLTTYLATGAELGRLHFLALLAETHGRLGQPEAGLQILADAISGAADKGERFYEAELYRLKGELLRQQGGPSAERQAEHYFQQALNVARRQQAKALELRAAVSLSRLWLGQGKRTESDQLLSDIYNWFQEGANMADHQEAVSLLEQLC